MLVGETSEIQSCGLRGARHRGEIDVRGEILLSGIGEGIIDPPVNAISGEAAFRARRMISHRRRLTVIDKHHPSALEFTGDRVDPRGERRTNLSDELRDVFRNRRRVPGERRVDKDKAGAVMVNASLAPYAVFTNEDLHGKGIKQLVGEENTGERREVFFVRDMREASGPPSKGFLVQRAEVFQRLYDNNSRYRSGPRGEDIGEKLSVVRPLFDESEVGGVAELFAHFEQLRGQKFSKNRSDADAGEKVAASPGARLIRGVVSVLRMIERDGHEFVESDGAVLRDAAAENFRGSVRAG